MSNEKLGARILYKSYSLARPENVKVASGLYVEVVEFGVVFPSWLW